MFGSRAVWIWYQATFQANRLYPYLTVLLILRIFSIPVMLKNIYIYSVVPYASQTAPPVHTRQIKFHNNEM